MHASDASAAVRPHVLLVEDDPQIAGLLARYLENHGFRCSAAADSSRMDTTLRTEPVDLILLDLGLPDEDGLMALRRLDRRVPVIIVTGRGESVDRVVGLELGADDYVTKPFEFRELLARVRSVLRRTQRSEPAPASAPLLRFDGLALDVSARAIVDREGRAVTLTGTEFELLNALVERPGQVLTRDQLMNHLHGRDAGPFDRAIDVHIGRLRRKLERDPAKPQLIQSLRGMGYRLAATVTSS
ncbi:response regulator transcription factor [Lysobacter arvi]|uniref:Response regulator transcription factor n=1 Tax=Lysobacter arvi TaxID=3038776 RepID=A0ABU1CB61_9GAMM|nr:response regulator transcription factor [Lysobacter arvi]MDR0181982.1 response regulator transcription factor [Lysobacter arvi]